MGKKIQSNLKVVDRWNKNINRHVKNSNYIIIVFYIMRILLSSTKSKNAIVVAACIILRMPYPRPRPRPSVRIRKKWTGEFVAQIMCDHIMVLVYTHLTNNGSYFLSKKNNGSYSFQKKKEEEKQWFLLPVKPSSTDKYWYC